LSVKLSEVIMNKEFDWKTSKQLSVLQLMFAVFIPSGCAFFGFHFILPHLVVAGIPILLAWPLVASIMLFILVVVAFILLRNESIELKIRFRERLCLKKNTIKQWILYIIIMFLGIAVTLLIQIIWPQFLNTINFNFPSYMPFFLNPSINASSTDPALLSPGLLLHGNWGLLGLMCIALLLNIMAEELYFRAWMLPKLSRFGNASWVINGTLFALYHTFQIWMFPIILIPSILFAFIFYHSKSIWPSFIGHFIGNFVFSIIGIIALILV